MAKHLYGKLTSKNDAASGKGNMVKVAIGGTTEAERKSSARRGRR